jgi:plastocyanin
MRSAMSFRIALALACALALLAGGAAAQKPPASKPATHTVVMEGVKYMPETLTVRRGDTVVWVNKDPFPHTVTAKGAFDSGSIVAGQSWIYTPRKAGEHAYICTFHPNMKGTLRVTPGE